MSNMILAFTLILFTSAARAADVPHDIRKSVVKIFTTYQKPNYYQPWGMQNEDALTGSGAIIAGNRILTNAHVVSDETYIQVRKAGEAQKYRARVAFVAHDSELALLTVDDPSFFKDARPLSLGDLPRQRDKVAAYGFPAGGDELSITEGTVSRIEVTRYTHSEYDILAVQTNAAINPGNSGGPVIKDGKMVGVSFQSFAGSGSLENTGYLVPTPVIRRFLKDISDGSYEGIPSMGVISEKLENRSLREYFRMPKEQTGIVATRIIYGTAAWGVIEPGDVITAIDGHPIANDTTYLLDGEMRLSYSNIITMHQVGDSLPVDLLRKGQPMRVSVKLKAARSLVDGPFYDKKPSYFILAGLVFVPLTRNLVSVWEVKDQLPIYRYLQELETPSADRTEAVFINFVLPHDINEGYLDLRSVLVNKVNGTKITKMADLVEAVKHPIGGYHVIVADGVSDDGQTIVIDAAKADAATKEILERQGIPSDRSPDLR